MSLKPFHRVPRSLANDKLLLFLPLTLSLISPSASELPTLWCKPQLTQIHIALGAESWLPSTCQKANASIILTHTWRHGVLAHSFRGTSNITNPLAGKYLLFESNILSEDKIYYTLEGKMGERKGGKCAWNRENILAQIEQAQPLINHPKDSGTNCLSYHTLCSIVWDGKT